MHRQEIRVRFCELDPYGHVNHSVYVQYFEAGRVEALDSVGMGLHVLQQELGLTIVVAEIQTKFVASAVLGDTWRARLLASVLASAACGWRYGWRGRRRRAPPRALPRKVSGGRAMI